MRVVLPVSFVCLEWAFSAQDLAPPAGFCGVGGDCLAKAKDAEDLELRLPPSAAPASEASCLFVLGRTRMDTSWPSFQAFVPPPSRPSKPNLH